MVSAPRGTKVVGLGCHYYVLAQVARGTAERFIKRSSYILTDICDEMNLQRRSIDDKLFNNPPGVTSFATLEESSLVLHTYFENNYSVTFDLTVDIHEADPNMVYEAFKQAIVTAVNNQIGKRPMLMVGQWFDRNTGRCRFQDRGGIMIGGDGNACNR